MQAQAIAAARGFSTVQANPGTHSGQKFARRFPARHSRPPGPDRIRLARTRQSNGEGQAAHDETARRLIGQGCLTRARTGSPGLAVPPPVRIRVTRSRETEDDGKRQGESGSRRSLPESSARTRFHADQSWHYEKDQL